MVGSAASILTLFLWWNIGKGTSLCHLQKKEQCYSFDTRSEISLIKNETLELSLWSLFYQITHNISHGKALSSPIKVFHLRITTADRTKGQALWGTIYRQVTTVNIQVRLNEAHVPDLTIISRCVEVMWGTKDGQL